MSKHKSVSIELLTDTLIGSHTYSKGVVLNDVPYLRALHLRNAKRAVIIEVVPDTDGGDGSDEENEENEMTQETATLPNTKETATAPKPQGNGKPKPPKVD
jgi:hypothetical protein